MSWRVVFGVAAFWLLVGVVLGSQTALGMTMQGNPVALTAAVRTALINWLPWIPVSLLAIALVERLPVTRQSWARNTWVHLIAIPLCAWVANLFTVLGFWWAGRNWGGWGTLVRQAAFWGTIRVHVALTVYVVTATLAQAWSYYRSSRERELRVARLEAQLSDARFQALNAQIRPHFLFNTLHTIGQLWRSGRDEEADALLDHLGALFQRVRASTDRMSIPLGDELAMVQAYLAIEQARFPDRLTLDVHASPEARSCAVPPLLLQPLVENAIRHGVSADARAGRVTVTGAVDAGRLRLEVIDDGPGMSNPTPAPGSGTGLWNTRERLQHAYGPKATFRVESADGRGTCVRIEIPAEPDRDAE
ncbi:MAG: histidine kinase [Gemmatimonadota bacterium]